MIYAGQSDFMKPYIFLNNEKTTECLINKDKTGVELFKLANNSNFDKQIENVTKYKDTTIANNADKAKKKASRVTLNNWHILSEFVTLYEMNKSTISIDKPTIIGFKILEISKLDMNIHYDRLKEIFSDNIHLLYTDTNTLRSFVKNSNPFELDERLKTYIDTSNFSINTIFPLKPHKNEKCFGCLKFENGECLCKEINAKAPKTYQEKRINQLRSVKAKGLKRGFKKEILKNDFKNVSFNEKPLRLNQKQIK